MKEIFKGLFNNILCVLKIHKWHYYYVKYNDVDILHRQCKWTGIKQYKDRLPSYGSQIDNMWHYTN